MESKDVWQLLLKNKTRMRKRSWSSSTSTSTSSSSSSSRAAARFTIQSSDILVIIFSYLDHFDLIRCSTVCKFWNNVIHTSDLLRMQYWKLQQDTPGLSNLDVSSQTSLNMHLEGIAMKHHSLSLQNDSVHIDQWNGHSVSVDQCRMKMGSILTGFGDKVMRIWSLDSYRCLEEYSVPDKAPLADFDFDESKIVGLVGTRICIWRRHGKRSIFPSSEGTFTRGLCMRYIDPEAVVGCEDGTARIFDMYSRNCSRIIKMHAGPITCLALTDDQLILSGSSLGSITVAGPSSDQHVTSLRDTGSAGIKSLCYNPLSHMVFAGSTLGSACCWDLRTMRCLWAMKISPNVIYSMQHLRGDTSSLVVGGIDGVLRILNQDTGEVVSSYVMNEAFIRTTSSKNRGVFIEKKKARKLSASVDNTSIHRIPKHTRPPITCLAVGMKKVVTIHNSKVISLWKFQ